MTIITTTWHRLEPRVRGQDPAAGLRAAVHDPLWLLGRQWQVGELLGEDAAFPVAVHVDTVEQPLSRWRAAAGQPVDYDPAAVPLEVMVEREPPVPPTLRQRLAAWLRLVELLDAAGLGGRAPDLAAAHPLPAARAPDPADDRLRLLAGGAGDGLAAATALAADADGLPANLVTTFLAWVNAPTPAGAGDCWVTDRLEYRFSIGAHTDAGELVLAAPEYLGGRLDWYDLDVDEDPAHSLATPSPAIAEPSPPMHLLPTRVTFPGMPAERFWELEDAAVDLGAVSAAVEDLGRLLTVEFATVFGNDWWSVPVRSHFGSLVGVRSLVVRDTFGQNVLIEPTESASTATVPWRMFRLTDTALAAGSGPAPAVLLLAPVIAGALDGDPVEDLLLLRDEMANLAWAVERVVEGADGRPRNRSIDYASRLTAAPPPELESPADLVYVLQTMVPEHWTPLVPVRDPGGTAAVVLQRGSLLTQDGNARPITAQGVLLEPDVSPWYFHEEEVPSEGLRVRRVPSIARWLDGTPYAWLSRRVGTGAGEGSSGLQFDIAVPPHETG
jgi:hypothetical protein